MPACSPVKLISWSVTWLLLLGSSVLYEPLLVPKETLESALLLVLQLILAFLVVIPDEEGPEDRVGAVV